MISEFDVAHLYDDDQLERTIDDCIKERDFWLGLTVRHEASLNAPYYSCQFKKYDARVDDLTALQKEKFGE